MRTSLCFFLASVALMACNESVDAEAPSTTADLSTSSTGTRVTALAKDGFSEDLTSALAGASGVPGVLEVVPSLGGQDELHLDLLGSRSFLLTDASDGSGPELIFPAYRDDDVDDGHLHAMKVFEAMTGAVENAQSIPTPTATLEYTTRTSAGGRVICISDGVQGGDHRFHCIIRGITQLEQSLTK